MVPLLIIIMLFLLADYPQKLKLEKVHSALIILFYVSPSYPLLQSHFKENAEILCKTSTTQENISRQNLLRLLKSQKSNNSSVSKWLEKIKSGFN